MWVGALLHYVLIPLWIVQSGLLTGLLILRLGVYLEYRTYICLNVFKYV